MALYETLSHAQVFCGRQFLGPSAGATTITVEPLYLIPVEQMVSATLLRSQLPIAYQLPDSDRAYFEDNGCLCCRYQAH